MGAKNLSGIRSTKRGGKPRLIIDFRYVDKDGKARRYCRDAEVQTKTAALAEAERLKIRAATTGSLARRAASVTFAAFIASPSWAMHCSTRCRPSTGERFKALFRQYVLDAFGAKRLDDIGPRDFRRFEASLKERGVQARGPVALVRTVFRVALESGAIEALPELPKLPAKSRKLPDAPDAAEVIAMLANATGWLRVAIALAVFAGLRMGEVRALEVRDVDLKSDRLLVRRAFSADQVITPKSGHERIVPLAPELRTILVDALRLKPATARVVVNSAGHTPASRHVLAALKRLQRRHGLRERSFHSLRHAFCSMLVRNGASVEAVRLLAGHSKLEVTQRYVHATAGDLVAAIAVLPKLAN